MKRNHVQRSETHGVLSLQEEKKIVHHSHELQTNHNQLCHYRNAGFIAFSFSFMKSSEIVLKS